MLSLNFFEFDFQNRIGNFVIKWTQTHHSGSIFSVATVCVLLLYTYSHRKCLYLVGQKKLYQIIFLIIFVNTYWHMSVSANIQKHLFLLFYYVRQKTVPFYFFNSFIKTSFIATLFGIRILR